MGIPWEWEFPLSCTPLIPVETRRREFGDPMQTSDLQETSRVSHFEENYAEKTALSGIQLCSVANGRREAYPI